MKPIDIIFSGLIISLSLFLLTRYIDKPFWGHHDWNSNIWTLTAKNNLNYGIKCTKLGQATTPEPINNCSQLGYYMDHPPLITWILTLSYALFGFGEWAGRLPFILLSSLSALLIFLIGKQLYNRWVGLVGGMFFMATPMFIYFGKAINHEPAVLFSTLLGVYSFIKWLKTRQIRWYYWYLVSSLLTGFSGWHGYLLYPILTIVTLWHQKKYFPKSLLAMGILFITFSLHQLHTWLISGKPNLELFSQFLTRTGLATPNLIEAQIIGFTYPKFFIQELRWLTIYFTRILCIGSLFFLSYSLVKFIKNKALNFPTTLVIALFSYGFTIPLIFSQQAFIHDYLNIYLAPFMAIATAIILVSLTKFLSPFLKIPLITLIILAVFLERQQFLGALQTSHANQPYVGLAKLILAKRQNPDAQFLIEANNFYNFAYPFLWNYAYPTFIDSRTDDWQSYQKRQKDLEVTYQYLITVTTHPVDEKLTSYWDKDFAKDTSAGFTFYKLPTTPTKIPKS